MGIRRKAIIIWLAVLLFFDGFLIIFAEALLVPRYEKLETEINRQIVAVMLMEEYRFPYKVVEM